MVPSVADVSTIGTRVSVLRTSIRTFMEAIFGFQERGTFMGSDDEIFDVVEWARQQIESSRNLLGPTTLGKSLFIFQELCAELSGYLT